MSQRDIHPNTIENPYRKNASIMSQNEANISTQNKMGPQSQMRGGSVKKCKEMGTKLKNKRKNLCMILTNLYKMTYDFN